MFLITDMRIIKPKNLLDQIAYKTYLRQGLVTEFKILDGHIRYKSITSKMRLTTKTSSYKFPSCLQYQLIINSLYMSNPYLDFQM